MGGVAVVGLVLAGGLATWAARYPEIEAVQPPDQSTFDADTIAKGESLAAIGNCVVCHTKPGGEPFAGGLPLPTPFGVIYSTNITPDPETGIGTWSEAAFRRALREGIDRGGNHLYPVFPYDHYTKVTDEDIQAIYAYMMTLDPVRATAPENELPFPFNIRLLLAGWNLLFLDQGVFQPDPSKDEEWNRGAYLAQGLGHCSSCHSPRNGLGGIDVDKAFAGGEAEGWHVPALNEASPAPVPWTADALVNYLIDGWDEHHGVAAGPMAPVVHQLSQQPEEEIYAIANYIASVQGRSASDEEVEKIVTAAEERQFGGQASSGTVQPASADPALQRGEAIFTKSCMNCHRSGSETVPLALTSTVGAPDARNVIHIVMDGIRPPEGMVGRSMPAFGTALSDEQIADLVTFVRSRFSDGPAWEGVRERVEEIRQHRGS